MSTFHQAASSLANFNDTILTISTTRLFIYVSCSHRHKNQREAFVMASQLTLFGDSIVNTKSTQRSYTREFKAALWFGGVVNFIIKRILGIKHIFPCSFGNKRMRLLTCVYGTLWCPSMKWSLSSLIPSPPPLLAVRIILASCRREEREKPSRHHPRSTTATAVGGGTLLSSSPVLQVTIAVAEDWERG